MNLKKYIIYSIILQLIIIGFLLPYPFISKIIIINWSNIAIFIISLSGPLVAGLVIWFLGEHVANKKIKQDAIRDLMTYRGADYASLDFRQSLNKVAIVFHNDPEIRQEVRHLYEVVNNPGLRGKIENRTIVGLIYKLCQRNGFKGLSEYDIDQSFLDPESQNPAGGQASPSSNSKIEEKPEKKTNKRNAKKKSTS